MQTTNGGDWHELFSTGDYSFLLNSYGYDVSAKIRTGDYDMDGYLDGIIVMKNSQRLDA